MASRDTTAASKSFQDRVLDVLRNPTFFPPEVSSWVRSQVVNNPVVQLSSFQLPNLDRKHYVGKTGEAFFLGGWANSGGGYEEASFYKDNESCVHLQGMVAGGSVGATIFTLPPSYRPVASLLFPVMANSVPQVLLIQNSGNVILVSGSNILVSLSGISFRPGG